MVKIITQIIIIINFKLYFLSLGKQKAPTSVSAFFASLFYFNVYTLY